jgi:branched-subunit amino acid transport protein AzlD
MLTPAKIISTTTVTTNAIRVIPFLLFNINFSPPRLCF